MGNNYCIMQYGFPPDNRRMSDRHAHAIIADLAAHGVNSVVCKLLSQNDNTKQQIYLGGNFQALNVLPFELVREDGRTFKADVNWSWMDPKTGHHAVAPSTKLILYPDYPEVRLSGFLRDCPIAPARHLQPVPRELRHNDPRGDGRVLLMGITVNESVIGILLPADWLAAKELFEECHEGRYQQNGIFYQIPINVFADPKAELLGKLTQIHLAGWHRSSILRASGELANHNALNGVGTTLEALFGIIPNSNAAPDYQGWELKAFSGAKITLMTPEPNGGFYKEKGAADFVRVHGHDDGKGRLYFSGQHKCHTVCVATGLRITIAGFDAKGAKITDPAGGIVLLDQHGENRASWSFAALMGHWKKKHTNAAYIPAEKRATAGFNEYRYLSPVQLGETTDFTFFLKALDLGDIVYDPGTRIDIGDGSPHVKARSQFRISPAKLSSLYRTLTKEHLGPTSVLL